MPDLHHPVKTELGWCRADYSCFSMASFAHAESSEDESGHELAIVARRRNPKNLSTGLIPPPSTPPPVADLTIAASPFSFSYTQDTGHVLAARLEALHRSLDSLNGSNSQLSHKSLANIAEALRDGLTDMGPQAETLLASPYMDINRPQTSHSLSRPSLFRRASSVLSLSMLPSKDSSTSLSHVLSSYSMLPTMTEISHLPSPASLSNIHTNGLQIADRISGKLPEGSVPFSPLHHLPSKQMGGRAIFTTSLADPFHILSLNDMACLIFSTSQQDARNRSLLDFIAPESRHFIRKHANSSSAPGVRLCGTLVQLNQGELASIWLEATQFLVWIVEVIPSVPVPPRQASELDNLRCYRDNGIVTLEQGHKAWRPCVMAAVIVVNASTKCVEACNSDVIRYLTGYNSIVGMKIDQLIPKLPELTSSVDISIVGSVYPEHYFRQLAHMTGSAFLSAHPHPTAITLRCHDGLLLGVDIQLRVISKDRFVLWVSYSYNPTAAEGEALIRVVSGGRREIDLSFLKPKQDSVASLPPVSEIPSQKAQKDSIPTSHIKPIVVGQNRRKLRLEDFEVLEVLGKGAYGEVRLVRPIELREPEVLSQYQGRTMALKSIYKSRILIDTWSRDKALGTVPNEIRIMNDLRSRPHPNIAEMIDFFEDTDYFHVLLAPHGDPKGTDLFDYIENQPTGVSIVEAANQARPIFSQIASAVAHLNDMGVIHRDIKDENIIVDDKGIAKLIDFGSAAYVKQGPFDVFVGTIDYAAPETLAGTPYHGPPQDIWALGILLYTMIYRENPFHSIDEIMAAKFEVTGLDPKCSNLIRMLLQLDVSHRPNANWVASHDFCHYLRY